MMLRPDSWHRSLEDMEEQLQQSAGPLVTEEQLARIQAITQTGDSAERVRRYNAVYSDLQRQLADAESAWSEMTGRLCGPLPAYQSPADRQLVSEANERAIQDIRAGAEALLNEETLSSSRSVPRGRRLTV